MTIQLNGEDHDLDGPMSVAELLGKIGFNRQPVIVELNGVALHRKDLEEARVEEGAKVEVVRIAAGG